MRIPEIGRIGQHDAAKPCLPVGIVVATGSISEKAGDPVGAEIFQAGDIAINTALKDVTEPAGLEVPRHQDEVSLLGNRSDQRNTHRSILTPLLKHPVSDHLQIEQSVDAA